MIRSPIRSVLASAVAALTRDTGGGAPAGFIYLVDIDGAYLTDQDGARLMEPI